MNKLAKKITTVLALTIASMSAGMIANASENDNATDQKQVSEEDSYDLFSFFSGILPSGTKALMQKAQNSKSQDTDRAGREYSGASCA
jgi:hypothetical protein